MPLLITANSSVTVADEAVTLPALGAAANQAAGAHTFHDFLSRKAANTITAQCTDLARFAEFLAAAGVAQPPTATDLQTTPAAWHGITWGLVSAFVQWQLSQGYAVSSVNRRLSTVKRYATLAAQAGALPDAEVRLIASVSGYGHKEGRNVDERRSQAGLHVRRGHKKAQGVILTRDQAAALKTRPDTPQGRRDGLLLCLLLDHGLRESEVARLTVASFNLTDGTVTFYRPKVNLEQTHKLTADTLRALQRYCEAGDCPASGPLLRGSRKGGALLASPLTISAIKQRVRYLGRALGLANLSPHDCRHYWATQWAGKVDVLRLQEAGGWNSLAMPRRYVARARIANEGMA